MPGLQRLAPGMQCALLSVSRICHRRTGLDVAPAPNLNMPLLILRLKKSSVSHLELMPLPLTHRLQQVHPDFPGWLRCGHPGHPRVLHAVRRWPDRGWRLLGAQGDPVWACRQAGTQIGGRTEVSFELRECFWMMESHGVAMPKGVHAEATWVVGQCGHPHLLLNPSLLPPDPGGYVGYALTTQWEGVDPASLQLIGFDMGGTSTDVSRYAGTLEHVFESTTAGVTIQAPQLDINTVAAGGGSRLFFESGVFRVGPESAGAHPGPVCYRKGGHLAITDANLVLGHIVPAFFPKIFGKTEDQPLDLDVARWGGWMEGWGVGGWGPRMGASGMEPMHVHGVRGGPNPVPVGQAYIPSKPCHPRRSPAGKPWQR